MRLHPWLHAGTATGCHDASSGCSAQLDELTHDEARRFVAGPPHRSAAVREVQPVENRPAIRVVVRRTLAAHIWRPHRHSPRIYCRVIFGHKGIHPAEKQATGVARPADLKLSRRGVRQGPQAGHFPVFGNGDPHDQRRAAEHDHVAVPIGTRDKLLAQRIDRTGGQHGVGIAQLADRGAGRLDPWHAVGRRAALRATILAPAGAVEQRIRRARGGIVEDRLAGQRVVGHCRRGPVPLGVGCLARRPAQEFDRLAGEERGVGARRSPSPAVAVQQARCQRPAHVVDGGQRRHHRRDGDRGGVGPAEFGPAPPAGPAATPRRRRARGGRGQAPGAGEEFVSWPPPGRPRRRPRP